MQIEPVCASTVPGPWPELVCDLEFEHEPEAAYELAPVFEPGTAQFCIAPEATACVAAGQVQSSSY